MIQRHFEDTEEFSVSVIKEGAAKDRVFIKFVTLNDFFDDILISLPIKTATGLADALDRAAPRVRKMEYDVTRELVESYVVLRNNYQLLWSSACSIAKEFGAVVPENYKAAEQRAEKAIGAFRKVYGF